MCLDGVRRHAVVPDFFVYSSSRWSSLVVASRQRSWCNSNAVPQL